MSFRPIETSADDTEYISFGPDGGGLAELPRFLDWIGQADRNGLERMQQSLAEPANGVDAKIKEYAHQRISQQLSNIEKREKRRQRRKLGALGAVAAAVTTGAVIKKRVTA